jgi:hopanoid-associated phosphorylase
MDTRQDDVIVVAAAGMDFEAKVAQGLGVDVVYGQNRARYRYDLNARIDAGARGIISFGIAGGLAPHLKPGDVVVASAVVTANGSYKTCPIWPPALRFALPHADYRPVFGSVFPALTVFEKKALWNATGSATIDLETGDVAEVADRRGVPFAVVRIVLDPAHREIPISALAGATDDGRTDALAVARALLRRPRDFVGLLRLANDSRAANKSLRLCREALGPNLGFRERFPIELPLAAE